MMHKDLAAGRWQELSLAEQMAHIGSEVSRAVSWKAKNRPDQSRCALERALELTDLTLAGLKDGPRLKEIARSREVLVDYFMDANSYGSTSDLLCRYYDVFAFAIRK